MAIGLLQRLCFLAAIAVMVLLGLAPVGAELIDFDSFLDHTKVAAHTAIGDQYLSAGVSFSSNGGSPVAVVLLGEASSAPNFLIGHPHSFAPIVIDFWKPINSVGVTLISVGDSVVAATAYADDLATVLDTVSVTNPGDGVGFRNANPITLSAPVSIRRLEVAITEHYDGDGFGIDDLTFQVVPESNPTVLSTVMLLCLCGVFRSKTSTRPPDC